MGWFVVMAALLAAAGDARAEEYRLVKQPAWYADIGAFGWECSPDVGEARECDFLGEPGTGIVGARFVKRFTVRTEEGTGRKGAGQRGTCRVFLSYGELREVMVLSLDSGEMGEISDSMCRVVPSGDGRSVGVAAAWADFEGAEDYSARAYWTEAFESLYWSILGRKLYRKHPEEAAGYLSHALALDPGDYRSRYKLAAALSIMGRSEEAIVQLAEAVSLQPERLRKQMRSDADFRALRDDEDFKLLALRKDGWKEIRARVGVPGPDALPPGLDAPVRAPSDEAAPEPEVEEAAPVEVEERPGCSCEVVG
jgi:hypothetical protein